MGTAIGAVLPLGIGVALSPIPIIAVVMMLGTPRGRANGPVFVLGWVLGLASAGAIVLALAAGADTGGPAGTPATWVEIVKIVLGVALVVLSGTQWHGRSRGDREEPRPAWMTAIDTVGPGRAFGLGVLLSTVNPKNLLLVVGAATAIAQTGVEPGGEAVALAVFVVLGALGPGIPVGLYFGLGPRSVPLLSALRTWMAAHNTAIMTVLLLVLGLKLAGDGLGGVT